MDLCSKRIAGTETGRFAGHAAGGGCLQMRRARLVNGPRASPLGPGCSEYAASSFRQVLQTHKVEPSMSRKGCCYDNAAMESFFATLKTECFQDRLPRNRAEAQAMLFDYIETFYNPQRLHSALGYLAPLEFEKRLHQERNQKN
jgi:transposase InsO family protein